MPVYGPLGTVSHGTMQGEDLIPAFVNVLDGLKDELATSLSSQATFEETEEVKRQVERIDRLLAEIEQRQQADDYHESEEADWDLEALCEALSEFAPPYCYFGAHAGDGSDYGFWVAWDALEDQVRCGGVLKWGAGNPWPELDEEVEYVLEVTDHGNGTLFDRDHNEVWSVV